MKAWKRGSQPPGWFPKRGDVCLIQLDQQRPAVILSRDTLNRHSLDVCVLPVSKAEHRAFSLRPKLRAGEGGLRFDSWVKCDQPTTIDKPSVVYPPLGTLSGTTLHLIEVAVQAALELP